jgi:carboxypeptidase family protein
MRCSLKLALTLLTIFRSSSFGAPDSITLRGIVEDQTSGAVPNAAVELSPSGGLQKRFAATDDAGTFRFENVSPGSYVMTIQHEGFETTAVPLGVGSTAPEPLNIVLAVAKLRQEITVSSAGVQLDIADTENQDFGGTGPAPRETMSGRPYDHANPGC